jgi:hypothetical protein
MARQTGTREADSGEPPAPPVSPAAPISADLLRRVQPLGRGREQDSWRRVHELRAGHGRDVREPAVPGVRRQHRAGSYDRGREARHVAAGADPGFLPVR